MLWLLLLPLSAAALFYPLLLQGVTSLVLPPPAPSAPFWERAFGVPPRAPDPYLLPACSAMAVLFLLTTIISLFSQVRPSRTSYPPRPPLRAPWGCCAHRAACLREQGLVLLCGEYEAAGICYSRSSGPATQQPRTC